MPIPPRHRRPDLEPGPAGGSRWGYAARGGRRPGCREPVRGPRPAPACWI